MLGAEAAADAGDIDVAQAIGVLGHQLLGG